MNYDPFKSFLKYAVEAESLQDFIDRYHKSGKITDFNREADYENHKKELEREGFTIIPASTSTTGEIVSYYGGV